MQQHHLRLALAALSLSLPLAAQETTAEELREAAQSSVNAGRWEDAAATYRKLVVVAPDDSRAWHMLGYTLHASGDLDAALKAHIKATKFADVAPVATYNVACVHALKGNSDEAIEWLNKAMELGFNNAGQLETDTDMDSLRSDPRFKQMLASMAKYDGGGNQGGGALQVFPGASARNSFRVLFWRGQGSPGQVVIDHGTPAWSDRFAKMVESGEGKGQRWRMGQNFWTTLDTNIDLEIGGTAVPAGYYYLALEQATDGAFSLVLLDPAKVRAKQLDAYLVGKTKGGLQAPMEFDKVEKVREKLDIQMKAKGTDGKLVVAFGPYRVHAAVQMHVDG